jgi:hypothetical protein
MSFSTGVADFMDTLGPFYEAVKPGDEINETGSHQGDSGIELDQGNINALLGNFGTFSTRLRIL